MDPATGITGHSILNAGQIHAPYIASRWDRVLQAALRLQVGREFFRQLGRTSLYEVLQPGLCA